MINDYCTDAIIIVSSSKDIHGVTTETSTAELSARVEETQQYVKGKEGVDVLANMLVVIDSDIDITWDDKIRVTKRCGQTANNPTKKNAIKSLEKTAGFDLSHWEMWL